MPAADVRHTLKTFSQVREEADAECALVLEAAWWGLFGGLALVAGSLVGLYGRVSTRVLGLVMAFGAGVLISAVSFELTLEAFEVGGSSAVVWLSLIHISEPTRLLSISYAVFCSKTKKPSWIRDSINQT